MNVLYQAIIQVITGTLRPILQIRRQTFKRGYVLLKTIQIVVELGFELPSFWLFIVPQGIDSEKKQVKWKTWL